MKIATWNVNSVRVREQLLIKWLGTAAPDVVCLQEIKATEKTFPLGVIESAGYNVTLVGQKSYNGVAILSRHPVEIEEIQLPGDESDEEARFLQARVGDIRVACIYLPNGNPIDGPKFGYKLAWMERLYSHVERLLRSESPFVLAGDFNICPTDADVYDPVGFANDALCRPETRACFRKLLYLGLTDAVRVFNQTLGTYTYWDYQAGRWSKDEGVRIDHLLLSPQAADRLDACEIDREPRGKNKPSDHTPVWCKIRTN